MDLCNSLMKRHFILQWCIHCLEHTDLHTLSTLLLTNALPQVFTHPPFPPKPGMYKHGPHLASATFLCNTQPTHTQKREGKAVCVYSVFLSQTKYHKKSLTFH